MLPARHSPPGASQGPHSLAPLQHQRQGQEALTFPLDPRSAKVNLTTLSTDLVINTLDAFYWNERGPGHAGGFNEGPCRRHASPRFLLEGAGQGERLGGGLGSGGLQSVWGALWPMLGAPGVVAALHPPHQPMHPALRPHALQLSATSDPTGSFF